MQAVRWWSFASDWHIWWLAAIWGLTATAIDGITFWAPTLIHAILDTDTQARGTQHDTVKDAVHAALASAIPYTAAAICMLVFARSPYLL